MSETSLVLCVLRPALLVSSLRVCGSRVPFSFPESVTAGERSPRSLLAQSPFFTTQVAFVFTFLEDRKGLPYLQTCTNGCSYE